MKAVHLEVARKKTAMLLGAAAAVSLSSPALSEPAQSGSRSVHVGPSGFAAIRTASMKATIDWYVDTLGFVLVSGGPPGNFALLRHQGLLLEVQSVAPPAPVPASAPLALGPYKVGLVVDNLDPVIAHLKRRGIAILGKVIVSDADGMRVLAVQDPDGTFVQVFGK